MTTTTHDEAADRELALVARHVKSYHNTENLYARDVEDVPVFEHHGPNIDCRIHLKERNGHMEWWICVLRYNRDYYVHGNGDDPEEALRHTLIELKRAVEKDMPAADE